MAALVPRRLYRSGATARVRTAWPPPVAAPSAREAIWRLGPKTSLPFWLGNFGGTQNIIDLMAGTNPGASGGLDLVLHYDGAYATFGSYVTSTVNNFTTSAAHTWLTSGKMAGFVWTHHPFCGGTDYVAPTAWPDDAPISSTIGLCPTKPPTYTGNETTAERRTKQLRVWQYGANGWLDDQWRARFVGMKRDYFNAHNLRHLVIVLRTAHELSLGGGWGAVTSPWVNSCAFLTTLADMNVVKAALARVNDIFKDVFGNRQTSIPNDTAYPADNLWTYFNPLSDSPMVIDAANACPDNADIAGPDYYDFNNPSATNAQWTASSTAMQPVERGGGPKGIVSWLNWAKGKGKRFGVGEWGLWSGPDPGMGGDNPLFVTKMLDLFRDNSADMAFACYFNRDLVADVNWPGHMIKSWSGIDTPATSCVRNPLGDNNQCGARAFRDWMKAR